MKFLKISALGIVGLALLSNCLIGEVLRFQQGGIDVPAYVDAAAQIQFDLAANGSGDVKGTINTKNGKATIKARGSVLNEAGKTVRQKNNPVADGIAEDVVSNLIFTNFDISRSNLVVNKAGAFRYSANGLAG